MADSKNNTNDSSTDDFADDLDAMLKDAEPETDKQDELIDDEDVIDRLLMDDEFSSDDEIEKQKENDSDTVDVDDLIDSTTKKKEEVDDFADEDEFDVDNLLDSVSTNDKVDEKKEVKEVAVDDKPMDKVIEQVDDDFDIDDLIDSTTDKKTEDSTVESDDDFLMADFDISSDDELMESDKDEVENVVVDNEPIEAVINESTILDENEVSGDFKDELSAQNLVVEQARQDLVKANDAITQLNTQMSQSVAENESLKTLLTELTAATSEKNNSALEELDTLQKEQRKLKKSIKESEAKVPVITYVVMAIAVIALLVGGGLGFVGYSAKTDAENLLELVSTLEEEIEIITAKDTTKDVREIHFKINELKIKDDGVDDQLLGMMKEIQTPKANSLQEVVDDLTVQNNHAQKAIEKLLASVETLEQKSVIAKTKRSVKRAKKVVKIEWVVNLVSFKQAWYAKRKAEEFKKKGILSKVEEVTVEGEKWFRLRVKGFKSKYEAAAYAVKVKKILNLSSVWVTKA